MNSCILMAEVIQEPQLRYTSDNQLPVAEMMVEFPGLRDDDPPARLKVVGWGNLAQQIQETYHTGDRVIVEGRLHVNSVDRQEGFKEKRAELTAQRIHRLEAGAGLTTSASVPETTSTTAAASPNRTAKPAAKAKSQPEVAQPAKTPAYSAPSTDIDYDDIPF
ncbi:MAG: single-stranded DNA-binding protein [Elainellaceae cyanobacterium]